MKITIYDLFNAYGLISKKGIAPTVNSWSDTRLTFFVEAYIGLAQKRELVFLGSLGATDIYPDSWDETMPFEVVKQLAIYANRIYLHDKLLHTARKWSSLDFDMSLMMQYPTHQEKGKYYRRLLAKEIARMMELRPLVEANVVHFTPTALIQPYRDAKDIYLDSFYGSNASDVLTLQRPLPPQAVIDYCRDHLKVVPVHFNDRFNPVIHAGEILKVPSRAIAIYFEGDPEPAVYQLAPISADSSEEGRINMHFQYSQQLHASDLDEAEFWNWVEGSKREQIRTRFERLQQDHELAAAARAQFLTSLPASKDLSVIDMTPAGRQRAVATMALLKMDLPYFDKASFASIAKARSNEEAFEDFRNAFQSAFKEVNALSDPNDVQRYIDEVTRDILNRPLAKIDRQMKQIHHKLMPGSLILLGTLVATLIMNGSTLAIEGAIIASAATVIAETTKAYQEHKEKQEQMKQLPSFFYWDVTHRRGGRK